MTQRQSLVMVELPLALPVIMAGIHRGDLGDRCRHVVEHDRPDQPRTIFHTGLQNRAFVPFGCAAAAVFAWRSISFLAPTEIGQTRDRKRTWVCGGWARTADNRRARSDAVAAARHLRDRHQAPPEANVLCLTDRTAAPLTRACRRRSARDWAPV